MQAISRGGRAVCAHSLSQLSCPFVCVLSGQRALPLSQPSAPTAAAFDCLPLSTGIRPNPPAPFDSALSTRGPRGVSLLSLCLHGSSAPTPPPQHSMALSQPPRATPATTHSSLERVLDLPIFRGSGSIAAGACATSAAAAPAEGKGSRAPAARPRARVRLRASAYSRRARRERAGGGSEAVSALVVAVVRK